MRQEAGGKQPVSVRLSPSARERLRSSVALRRLGALLVLGGLAFYFTAYKLSQVVTAYLFFGLGGVFVAMSFVARAIEEKGGRDEQ